MASMSQKIVQTIKEGTSMTGSTPAVFADWVNDSLHTHYNVNLIALVALKAGYQLAYTEYGWMGDPDYLIAPDSKKLTQAIKEMIADTYDQTGDDSITEDDFKFVDADFVIHMLTDSDIEAILLALVESDLLEKMNTKSHVKVMHEDFIEYDELVSNMIGNMDDDDLDSQLTTLDYIAQELGLHDLGKYSYAIRTTADTSEPLSQLNKYDLKLQDYYVEDDEYIIVVTGKQNKINDFVSKYFRPFDSGRLVLNAGSNTERLHIFIDEDDTYNPEYYTELSKSTEKGDLTKITAPVIAYSENINGVCWIYFASKGDAQTYFKFIDAINAGYDEEEN